MTEFQLLELLKETIYLSFILSLPMLAIGTVVGVIVSIFQTVTSIQDQSLAFIPKLFATMVSVILFGPWMLAMMKEFTVHLLTLLPQFAK
ncbi:MAG: flagellar biosynthetic protein FliQ [Candidatus Riflebacteria bacterium]|nr:flagellar biosynthetic protein FliQ [Candidatus Riflebacteria bacterium]